MPKLVLDSTSTDDIFQMLSFVAGNGLNETGYGNGSSVGDSMENVMYFRPPERSGHLKIIFLISVGFPSNTGPDPLKNHMATKPAFNIGPSSARQRNVI